MRNPFKKADNELEDKTGEQRRLCRSRTHHRQAQCELEKIVFFVCESVLVPLLRRSFHVTTAEPTGQSSIYFRKCDWAVIQHCADASKRL